MKEVNRHREKQHCGSCARTIKLRHDPGKLACTAHLMVVPVDHVAECGEYESTVYQELPVASEMAPASSSTDGAA